MLCQCGQEINPAGQGVATGTTFRTCQYDADGNIVFAICIHGYIVIDNREEDEK